MLEAADFAAPDLDGRARRRRCGRAGPAAASNRRPGARSSAGLRAALETPLGPLLDGRALRDVARADRLDELAFELPLAGGDAPSGRLTLGADRRRAACALPTATRSRATPSGSTIPTLRASRARLPDRQHRPRRARRRRRFASLDYKTNWLAPPGEPLALGHHYRPARSPPRCSPRTTGCRRCCTPWRCTATCAGGCRLRPRAPPRRRPLPVPARDDRRRRASGVFAWRPPAALVRRAERRCSTEGPRERVRRSARRRRAPRAPRAAARVQRRRRARRRRRPRGRAACARWPARPTRRSCSRPRWPCAAPRLGHVYVDLATIRDTATVDTDEPVDLAALPWPTADGWTGARGRQPAASRGAARRAAAAARRQRLYLDRYWREERQVAADLRALAADAPAVDDAIARATASSGCSPARPTSATRAAAARPCGGGWRSSPAARAPARPRRSRGSSRCWPSRRAATPPLIALAAPTGKAAARLAEAVHDEAERSTSTARIARASCSSLHASTLHRLLGWQPGSHSRFRHDRANRLPHDVVIVDETSMVSLSQMARLVEAVRPSARLILVGDPGQLASIEAGAVLGDIVGAGRPRACVVLARVPPLRRRHRRSWPTAIRRGDADAAIAALHAAARRRHLAARRRRDRDRADGRCSGPRARGRRRARLTPRAGDAAAALAALGGVPAAVRAPPRPARGGRLDGAHRGAGSRAGSAAARWYPGRPLLVTENDYGLEPLQRRHRRRRDRRRRPPGRAAFERARADARGQPHAARAPSTRSTR